MTDECKVEGCAYERTGFCREHDIEVERRKDTGLILKKLQSDTKSMDMKLNWALGVLAFIMVAITGSYLYAGIVNDASVDRDKEISRTIGKKEERLEGQITTLCAQVSKIANVQSSINTQQISLVKRQAETTKDLKENTLALRDVVNELKNLSFGARNEH